MNNNRCEIKKNLNIEKEIIWDSLKKQWQEFLKEHPNQVKLIRTNFLGIKDVYLIPKGEFKEKLEGEFYAKPEIKKLANRFKKICKKLNGF